MDSVYEQLSHKNPNRDPELHHIEVASYTKKGVCFPRIWFKPGLWEYTKTHNFWGNLVTGEIYKSSVSGKKILNILSRTNDKGRDPDYILRTRSYQGKLMAYEKPFKDQYRKVAKNAAPPKEYSNVFGNIPMV